MQTPRESLGKIFAHHKLSKERNEEWSKTILEVQKVVERVQRLSQGEQLPGLLKHVVQDAEDFASRQPSLKDKLQVVLLLVVFTSVEERVRQLPERPLAGQVRADLQFFRSRYVDWILGLLKSTRPTVDIPLHLLSFGMEDLQRLELRLDMALEAMEAEPRAVVWKRMVDVSQLLPSSLPHWRWRKWLCNAVDAQSQSIENAERFADYLWGSDVDKLATYITESIDLLKNLLTGLQELEDVYQCTVGST